MRTRLASISAGIGALALAVTGIVAIGTQAEAYSGTPPWVGNTDDAAHVKGSLVLYDASGAQITSGSSIQALAAYVGTTGDAPRANATKATANLFSPDPANTAVTTWGSIAIQSNYTWSPTPAGVPSFSPASGAFIKLNASGQAIEDLASGLVLYAGADAAYLHTLEIRVQDSGVGVVADGLKYWRTIIEYNPTSAVGAYDGLAPGAWKQIYPVVSGPSTVATTTTTPTATPSGSQVQGTSITFSTTVKPASGTLTGGTVTFFDGATQIGATKTISGTATSGSPASVTSDATTSLSVGTHSITAQFTPSAGDAAAFGGSTSTALSQVITSVPVVADSTTTAIVSTSPAGTATTSDTVTVTVHVADASNSGTKVGSGAVAVKAGSTVLSQGAVSSDGDFAATFVAGQYLALGSNSIIAEYTGNASFNSSTASPTMYTITLGAPSNVVLPAAGAARVGAISTCNPGSWSAAFAYTYEWFQRTNASAAWTTFGGTRSTAVLPATYAGHQVKCVVTAYNPATAVAESPAVTVALGAASRATTKPRILGTPVHGKRLTANRGIWSPTPTKYLYVWKIGSAVVARTATYVPPLKFNGKYLVLVVSAVRTGYLTGTAVSARVLIR